MHVCLSCGMHNCVFPEEQSDKVCQTFRELAIDLPIDHHLPFVHVLSLAELEKCVSVCSCLKISYIFNQSFWVCFFPTVDSFTFALFGLFSKLCHIYKTKEKKGRSKTTERHGQYIMMHVRLELIPSFR